MRSYILRQLAIGGLTLLGSVVVIFFIIHLVPGDPVLAMLQDTYSEEAYAALRQGLGLDQPLAVQFVRFVKGLAVGELGDSFSNQQPVAAHLAGAFPHTIQLALAGIALAAAIGVPAGILAAVYRNRWPDYLSMVLALFGVCSPSFWLGVLLVLAFAVKLEWFPTVGVGDGPGDRVLHLVLPALTVGARAAGVLARITRSSLLEVLGQDYIRTAVAKGLHRGRVVLRHAVRNAAIPVLTVLGLELGHLLGGTAVVELVFARRGLGSLLVDAVRHRDYPVIQGALLLYMAVVLTVNFLTDLAYGAVDPRIRYA